MADDRIFTLVGKFDDKITPSLTKLSKSISGLTRDFDKLKRNLRPIAKDMAIMGEAANRVGDGFRNQRGAIDSTVRGLAEYRREMGKATAAQQKFQRQVKLPTYGGGGGGGGSARRPRGGGGGGYGGRGGGQTDTGGMQKMGLGAMALAGGAVGVGFTAATAALSGIKNAAMGFVQSGAQAEQAVIGMAGTLQTLGKVGNFQKSRSMAEEMMGSLSKVAAALPGSTEDYLTILQQTLDDQIQAFGSVAAVQDNLKGIGKDGKKMAGGMEASFTALFGMSAQIAGLRPQIAAMDLNQLRMNPTNLKNVQVLSRNPTLSKFYLEELKKSGGNFIMALNNAMKKAITPEQVEALKNSFDSAYQSFVTTFTDAYSGILAPMRKVTIKITGMVNGVATSMDKSVNMMEVLGTIMRNINDIIAVLLGTGIDPLVMLNQFLYEFGYQVYKLKRDLEHFAKDGLDLEEFGEAIGRAIGDAAANLGNWLANLDYASFFKGVDKLVYGFFKGLFAAFLESFRGVQGENEGPAGAMGSSVTGTIVSLLLLTKVVTMAATAFAAISGFVGTVTTLGAGIATVAQVGFPILMAGISSAASAFAAVALPALAIAGAFLALFALFRHGDFILSSLWESVQLVVNGLTWLNQSFQLLIAKMMAGILDFMSKLPVVGGTFKDAAAAANANLAKISQDRLETEKKIAANTKKIGENTANSLKRTKEDFAKVGGAFKGAMPGAGKPGLTEAQKKAITPEQVEALKRSRFGPQPAQAAATSKAGAAPAPSLAPLQAAVTAGTSATQGVKTAVTASTAATVKATQSTQSMRQAVTQGATTQSSQMATLISSTNGVRAAVQNIKIPAPTSPATTPTTAKRKWDGKGANSMPVHAAIASEMANKPAGSDLVIANSSETIIPAAGGLGSMDGMVNAIYGAAQNTAGVFSAGFQTFSQKVTAGQQATVAAINKSTQVSSAQSMAMLAKLSAQNAALMTKISASPAFMGSAGGMAAMALGGGYGSRGSQIAGALGNYLKSTGGAPGSIHEHPQHGGVKYKHSPTSYHYQGRALDIGAYAYEQGGVLARVAQFNAKMGVKPVELLKAGDPGHSDHVHVAYAMGSGNPAFFSSASAADKWESMMAGKNSIIGSVRAQSREMKGGTMTVNAPITIHQQPGQDSDQLASLVAIKLTQAVNQLRYSSYNV